MPPEQPPGVDRIEQPAKSGEPGLDFPGQKLREEALGYRQSSETFQLQNDRYEQFDSKLIRTASQVGLATVSGAAEYGIDHAVKHPFQFAGELAGAAVLPIALRGPAWTKVPAMVVTGVGGVTFAVHVADAVSESLPAIKALWDSPTNTKSSAELIKQSLGPVAFDTMMMTGAGVLGNRAAIKLHEVDPVLLRATLAERSSTLAQMMGMSNQPELSFAGMGRIPETRIPSPNKITELGMTEPLQMAAHDATGGGGGRKTGGRTGADAYRYVKQNRPNGDVVHDFVNAKAGSVNGNTFNHGDGTKLFFGHDGRMQVTFGTGQVRNLHLGSRIGHINIVEKPSGLKEFRLNGSDKAQVTTDNNMHTIKAKLADGTLLRHLDVTGPTTFNHADGLKTTIDPHGRLIFQLPGGANKVVTLNDRIGQVRILDHQDGSKEISMWNREGMSHQNQVDVPPLPKSLTQQAKPNSLAQQWKEIQAKGAGGGMEAGPTGTVIKSTVEMMPQHQGKGDDNPFWRLPLPGSVHRGIVDNVVGIDHRTMPSSDLRTTSDIGLAIQDHHWVVKDFLAGLGKGGNNNGIDFDW